MLQLAVAELMSEVTGGHAVTPGVDGCGVPCFRTTTQGLATAYARLTSVPRFAQVVTAMHRYPALVSGVGNVDAAVAVATAGIAKRGAEGCLAIGLPGGTGIAIKAWDGSSRPLGPAAVRVLDEIGLLSEGIRASLEGIATFPVLGGGAPVGEVRPVVRLHRP